MKSNKEIEPLFPEYRDADPKVAQGFLAPELSVASYGSKRTDIERQKRGRGGGAGHEGVSGG